jgi:hypothetical protein
MTRAWLVFDSGKSDRDVNCGDGSATRVGIDLKGLNAEDWVYSVS